MSPRIPWDPFLLKGESFSVYSSFESIDTIEVVDQLDAYDPFVSELMYTQLRNLISMQSIVTNVDRSDEFQYISTINSKRQDSITPEELISHLCIGLKTAARTLKNTTHQYIHTTGFLTKGVHSDKSHLCYKQLC